MISGEAQPFIEALEFYSKKHLTYKLRKIRDKAAELAPPDDRIVCEMVSACLCEVSACPENELMKLKRYLRRRKHARKNKAGKPEGENINA